MLRANSTFSGKNKSRQKKNKRRGSAGTYLCAFFVPVAILLLILAGSGIFPLGEECFLRTDMYHQYAPFFSEFREKLRTGGSLLYSWDIGLGVNFAALYAYYLASPLNWLIALCPKAYIIEFMMLMTVGKIGLSGLSMAFYCNAHRDKNADGADIGAALFGIFYALSGYVCAYYWNMMWLDCIILFPLIIYGAERLLSEGRGGLYTLTLGVCILSNYYISIMICLFLVLYFAAWQALCPPKSVRAFFLRAGGFAWYSLLAGGLAAVLLLPEIYALQQTASADMNFPQTFSQYFSVIDMFARHMPGVETEQALDHWPNIYCGTAVFLLFGLYLAAREIRLREKIVYVTLLTVLLVSFSINVLNFIWHGFHYPNSLPARQSFIYVFLMLFLCYRVYQVRFSLTKRQLSGAFLAAAAFILYCQKSITAKHFHFAVFYAALLMLALYAGLLYLHLTRRIRAGLAGLLALCLVAAEAAGNAAATSITTTSRVSYTKDNDDVRALVESLFPSSSFFRVEKISRKTKNDGAWMNFPSVSLFSSLANADCSNFFETIGCEASTNAYSITGSTPLVNMLFSVRYAIYSSPQENGAEKEFVESRGESYLYRNRYALPLGFVMPQAMADDWMLELDNPALVQNALCDAIGAPAVLVPNGELGSEEGARYAATISQDGEYYAFVKNPKVRKVTVSWPEKKKTFDNTDRGYFLELGQCYQGDLIQMESETDGQDLEVELYRFDYDALRIAYEKLSQQPLNLTVWEDARLSGSVTVNPSELGCSEDTARLFLSIPYDAGWTVQVDGAPVETEKAFDTFLSVSLPAGEHTIELSYMPQGLEAGALISAGSILLLIITAGCAEILRRRRVRRMAGAEALTENEEAWTDDPDAEYDAADDGTYDNDADDDAYDDDAYDDDACDAAYDDVGDDVCDDAPDGTYDDAYDESGEKNANDGALYDGGLTADDAADEDVLSESAASRKARGVCGTPADAADEDDMLLRELMRGSGRKPDYMKQLEAMEDFKPKRTEMVPVKRDGNPDGGTNRAPHEKAGENAPASDEQRRNAEDAENAVLRRCGAEQDAADRKSPLGAADRQLYEADQLLRALKQKRYEKGEA